MNSLQFACAPLLASLFLGGCSSLPLETNPNIGTSVTKLGVQTSALQTVLKSETDSLVTVRRDEAIRYWIRNPNALPGENLNANDPVASFVNFVCAGSGQLGREQRNIAFLSSYADAVKAATDPGPDTFEGQMKKFLNKNGDETLPFPEASQTPEQIFGACATQVQIDLALYQKPHPISDINPEFIGEAVAVARAAQAVIDSLKSLATDGLTVVNSVAARRRLKTFLKNNQAGVEAVTSDLLARKSLDNAWDRRRALVLGSAYLSFSKILHDTSPVDHEAQLRSAGIAVSDQLATYDKMRQTPKPSAIVTAWQATVETVSDEVNSDHVSMAAVVSYLDAANKRFDTIQSDYENVNTKFDAFTQALKTGGAK